PCNNIGAVQRRQIHEAFRRWLNIEVRPEDEFSQRRTTDELTCLTDQARRQLQPRPLQELLAAKGKARVAAARKFRADMTPEERRRLTRQSWSRLLGDIDPPKESTVHKGSPHIEERGGLTIRRALLETELGILV